MELVLNHLDLVIFPNTEADIGGSKVDSNPDIIAYTIVIRAERINHF